MSSGSSKESIIIVDDDYNYTNYFMVYDINSDDVVTR
jgi:hypothetical protein